MLLLVPLLVQLLLVHECLLGGLLLVHLLHKFLGQLVHLLTLHFLLLFLDLVELAHFLQLAQMLQLGLQVLDFGLELVGLLASRRKLLLLLAAELYLKLQLHLYLIYKYLLILVLAQRNVAARRLLNPFLLLLLEQKLHLLYLLYLLNLLHFELGI